MSVQIMLQDLQFFEKKEDRKVKIKMIAGLTEKENIRWKLNGNHKTKSSKSENCD